MSTSARLAFGIFVGWPEFVKGDVHPSRPMFRKKAGKYEDKSSEDVEATQVKHFAVRPMGFGNSSAPVMPPGSADHAFSKEKLTLADLRPQELENAPPILRLPVELLQTIYEYLSVDSQVLFSLSSKHILHTVGNSSWTLPSITGRWSINYRADVVDRVNFLTTLSRDLRGSVYCGDCKVLHPVLPPPSELKLKKTNRACLTSEGVINTFPDDRAGDRGYVIVWSHVKQALDSIKSGVTEVPFLETSYSVTREAQLLFRPETKEQIEISASVVDRNLILKQERRFSIQDASNPSLYATHVTSSKLRLCPHMTTAAGKAPKGSLHKKNSPFLTHCINAAFPVQKRAWGQSFRDPSVRESAQMKSDKPKSSNSRLDVTKEVSKPDEDFYWCRSCPTKFQVKMDGDYQQKKVLVVTAWHNFGTSEQSAMRTFQLLKRVNGGREANSEFFGLSRTFDDFRCV